MKRTLPIILTAGALSLGAISAEARSAEGLKIFINPGHGGHDSDDRQVIIAPHADKDTLGFWESNSNLTKGLFLRDMLEAKGYEVQMSRIFNRTQDDLPLKVIVDLSNASGADLFFSIHSNATGTDTRRNFPMMFFNGYDDAPTKPEDKVICTILDKYLLENQTTVWTHPTTNVRGDLSFYHNYTYGLGVLYENETTGLLSEGSFHDYIPETYRLMSKDYCWLEAYHFRKAIDEYLQVDPDETGVIAGRINDNRFPREGSFLMFGDDKLNPISNATVILKDKSNNTVATYVTDPVYPNGLFLFKDLQPGDYVVEIQETDTHHGTSVELSVTADNVTYTTPKLQHKRLTPPTVTAYSPVWNEGDEGTLCNVPINVTFYWDMDTEATEKAFSISPEVDGSFSWKDQNTTLVFTPSKTYAAGTEYTVTISTDAKHSEGINMTEPFSFKFKTNDRESMRVLTNYPYEGAQVHYTGATVEFRFDKKPNTNNLLNILSCTDSKGNNVSFNRRSLKSSTSKDVYGFIRIPFTKALTIGETYTLSLGSALADNDGITLSKDYNINFTAVDATHENTSSVQVDDMSGNNFSFDEYNSTGVTSASIAASTTQKLFTKSQAITYTFDGVSDGEANFIRSLSDTDATIMPSDFIGIHVYGDLSNNKLYLELASEISVRYVPVCELDFLGWKYIEVPASAAEAASRFTGIKIVEVPSQMSKTGTVYIDRITSGPNTGAGVDDAVVSQITVYPNPASQYLIANAPSFITSVALIDLNGRTVAQTGGNVLNVSAIHNGHYLMRVNTSSSSTIHKVVIKH